MDQAPGSLPFQPRTPLGFGGTAVAQEAFQDVVQVSPAPDGWVGRPSGRKKTRRRRSPHRLLLGGLDSVFPAESGWLDHTTCFQEVQHGFQCPLYRKITRKRLTLAEKPWPSSWSDPRVCLDDFHRFPLWSSGGSSDDLRTTCIIPSGDL